MPAFLFSEGIKSWLSPSGCRCHGDEVTEVKSEHLKLCWEALCQLHHSIFNSSPTLDGSSPESAVLSKSAHQMHVRSIELHVWSKNNR